MPIRKSGNQYEIESLSHPGTFYKVDPDKPFCNCPGYRFHYLKTGGVCKHITAVQEQVNTSGKRGKANTGILSFVEKAGEVDAMELIKKFGDAEVDGLIKRGELIEQDGMIKILK
ncbi:MAG TPA: SWIM zinc finger family protein, partial [Candidatus Nanoarchaeia archaeon]|nr:SWIM zinc finger family protein [Candidatus Nanoarchaeia archaeon]